MSQNSTVNKRILFEQLSSQGIELVPLVKEEFELLSPHPVKNRSIKIRGYKVIVLKSIFHENLAILTERNHFFSFGKKTVEISTTKHTFQYTVNKGAASLVIDRHFNAELTQSEMTVKAKGKIRVSHIDFNLGAEYLPIYVGVRQVGFIVNKDRELSSSSRAFHSIAEMNNDEFELFCAMSLFYLFIK